MSRKVLWLIGVFLNVGMGLANLNYAIMYNTIANTVIGTINLIVAALCLHIYIQTLNPQVG